MLNEKGLEWPERLMLRDTKVFADEGQRIFTTATGYGYEKREYVRADLAVSPEAPEDVAGLVERPRKDLADWSALPQDIYVVGAKSPDGIVFDVSCCSVPMVIGPEVRYTLASAAEAEATRLRGELARVERDAARYRWLRDDNAYVPEEQGIRGGVELDELCDEDMP